MSDFLSEFNEYMREHGFLPRGGKVVADDKWHQAQCDGDSKHAYSGTYTMKIVDSSFAIGCFFSRKDPDKKIKWHSSTREKLPPDERKRRRKMADEIAREKEIKERRRQERLAERLARAYHRMEMAPSDHEYLTRKGIKSNVVIRIRSLARRELVIPLRDTAGKLWSIQRITEAGNKYLWRGGRKRGHYCQIGGVSIGARVFVCEGYATGSSIYDATGEPTVCAIDSGNLKEVVVALNKKYPAAQIIVCADNDAYTKNAKGAPWNVGVEKAKEAVAAIGGGYVIAPEFAEPSKELTDFNDLAQTAGVGEVARQIKEFLDKIPAPSEHSAPFAPEEAADGAEHSPVYSDQHSVGGDLYHQDRAPIEGDFGMNFKVLGYNEGVYYYFPFNERQIVALTATAHTIQNLVRLDDMENWMAKFGGTEISEKKVCLYAMNALMSKAKQRGVFEEENRVRGSGAWLDNGRKILHCGDVLYVDGVQTEFDQLESDMTYIASSRLLRPAPTALNNSEAYALRQICEAVTWENKLSGSLLAGWLVVAPVCGALPYRPHVWITGEAESGKSTVLDKIIKPVLGRISFNVDGTTTEPTLRQKIGYGARPIVFDEAEKSTNMEGVLNLARLSSSGGVVGRYGQKMFQALSCFCFSAINPPVSKTADESRIAFMVIKKNRRPTAIEEYNALLDMIEKTITPDYSSRMLTRTLENLDALFDNINTFQKAARIVIRGARASQIVGIMLAGLYLLSKTDRVTPEAAEEWIRKYDWSTHTMIDKETDPARLLQYLSGCFLRYGSGSGSRDVSIGDLIMMRHKELDSAADKLLRSHGIAVKDGRVYIASSCQHLGRLLRDTDWGIKWTRMLENIEGAKKEKVFYFRVGLTTSGVSLPVSAFSAGDKEEQPVLRFDEPEMEEIEF